jgi:hypothetical protein
MRREKPEDYYFDDECPPDRGITVKLTEHFDARGMVRVYGRGNHFPECAGFHMDVWTNREGRLLARFWSYGATVDGMSYEILGITTSRRPKTGPPFDCRWVPQCLRQAYHNWISYELHLCRLAASWSEARRQ